MNRDLDRARVEMEMQNVKAARITLEYQRLERLEDIKRIEKNIEIQLVKESELETKLKEIIGG